ncbi:MAG: hypothetical protein E7595_07705 [Ruminococcaceae bacterium]|nr:hypothetical protein [Oscillospiraceae bacterium]
MKKYLFTSFLAFCLCLMFLCSCQTNDVLLLNSGLFSELESAEIDAERLKNRWISGETNCYNGPAFELNERDGEIYLEEYSESYSYVCNLNMRYLVGIDCGEFDGWVSVIEYDSNRNEEAKNERLLNENCRGFLKEKVQAEYKGKSYWTDNNDKAYIFTGLAHLTIDKGKIYKFENKKDGYSCELFADLGSSPDAFLLDNGNIIVATNKALLSVDPAGNITTLFSADYWRDLGITSMVKLGESYYIGTFSGILEYRIADKSIVWYPYYNEDEQ